MAITAYFPSHSAWGCNNPYRKLNLSDSYTNHYPSASNPGYSGFSIPSGPSGIATNPWEYMSDEEFHEWMKTNPYGHPSQSTPYSKYQPPSPSPSPSPSAWSGYGYSSSGYGQSFSGSGNSVDQNPYDMTGSRGSGTSTVRAGSGFGNWRDDRNTLIDPRDWDDDGNVTEAAAKRICGEAEMMTGAL